MDCTTQIQNKNSCFCETHCVWMLFVIVFVRPIHTCWAAVTVLIDDWLLGINGYVWQSLAHRCGFKIIMPFQTQTCAHVQCHIQIQADSKKTHWGLSAYSVPRFQVTLVNSNSRSINILVKNQSHNQHDFQNRSHEVTFKDQPC